MFLACLGSVHKFGDLTNQKRCLSLPHANKANRLQRILSMFLPSGILDYFEFANYLNMGKYYVFSLQKKSEIPTELTSCLFKIQNCPNIIKLHSLNNERSKFLHASSSRIITFSKSLLLP